MEEQKKGMKSMEVEEPTLRAENFSFENCIAMSKKKEVIDPLYQDPVFGGEVTTGLKKQVSAMQSKLNEINEQYSWRDFADMHPPSLINYVNILEEVNEKLNEDEKSLTYLYNLTESS